MTCDRCAKRDVCVYYLCNVKYLPVAELNQCDAYQYDARPGMGRG